MEINSAKFIKTAVGDDAIFLDGIPQVALIGRSNVGKSSTINAFTKQKGLAIVSSSPGRTQGLNVFLINENRYLVDLPGYGFAKLSKNDRKWLHGLIDWYLFNNKFEQRLIVQIIDAEIGPTKDDLELLSVLKEHHKPVLVLANKIDKIKKSQYVSQCQKIKQQLGEVELMFYSSKTGSGIREVVERILC